MVLEPDIPVTTTDGSRFERTASLARGRHEASLPGTRCEARGGHRGRGADSRAKARPPRCRTGMIGARPAGAASRSRGCGCDGGSDDRDGGGCGRKGVQEPVVVTTAVGQRIGAQAHDCHLANVDTAKPIRFPIWQTAVLKKKGETRRKGMHGCPTPSPQRPTCRKRIRAGPTAEQQERGWRWSASVTNHGRESLFQSRDEPEGAGTWVGPGLVLVDFRRPRRGRG